MTGTIFEDNEALPIEESESGLLFNEGDVAEIKEQEDEDDVALDLGLSADDILEDALDFMYNLGEDVEALSKNVVSMMSSLEVLTDHILKLGDDLKYLKVDLLLNEPSSKEEPKPRTAGRPARKPPKIQIPKKRKAIAKAPAKKVTKKKVTKKKVKKSKR